MKQELDAVAKMDMPMIPGMDNSLSKSNSYKNMNYELI
jgi:hypothetical protein